ncbi:MAG: RecBCD enzyme subunit RecD [Chlamydiae bacterium]|nr:RecBCD enzyme subunit RecD [Chlamydiota bacterium]
MEYIDTLFAERLFPHVDEEGSRFLAKLLAASREGHLCLPHEPSADHIPEEAIGEIICREGDRWYLKRCFKCEKEFVFHWQRLKKSQPKPLAPVSLEGIPEQVAAVQKALQNPVTLICGGPGTGKTTTAALLVREFYDQMTEGVALAAPTGKAAANLRSRLDDLAEKCTITTLHRLLSQKKTLPFDLIVVDEGSMIDAELMARLFGSIKEGARLILLGDKDQLPPVESGNFFADLANHEKAAVAELNICQRTDLQEIIEMAAAVKSGEMISIQPLPDVKRVVEMIAAKKPWEKSRPFCALTPLRQGLYGVDHLNALLYQKCSKGRPVPILITANDPKLELFNGDIGWLEDEQATFSDGRTFPAFLLPRYEYAYLLSVHKSQGSEYDEVMILLPEGAEKLGREMLYTAITRARKKVTVFGSEETLAQVVSKRAIRYSGWGA